MTDNTIKLGHGSGGTLTRELIEGTLLRFFDSPLLSDLPDSAVLPAATGRIAFTTDTYVVDPIFFPGGDIGKLAVCGTVNDLAVVGATPRCISCALILEEGLPQSDLEVVLSSMEDAAEVCQVEVVTGDTKVVPRGKADGIFINTAGIGIVSPEANQPGARMEAGDAVLVTGPVGDHGAAVLAQRQGLHLKSEVLSDCAPLTALARTILEGAERVSFLRDVTRGGLATILNEAAEGSGLGIVLDEETIPVRPEVRSICELLGIDPLYLACEGRLAAVLDADSADSLMEALSAVPDGDNCAIVGRVTEDYPDQLVAQTPFGTHRLIQMLSGEQLPRIC